MTPTQITALRAKVFLDAPATALLQAGDTAGLRTYLNAAASPTYSVWRNSTSASDIDDAVIWANLTPTDAPDGTAIYTNRALLCQAKQINVQILLQGRDTINSSKSNIRGGLQDSLTNVPSGVSGATQPAGWTAVKGIMTRTATVAEKMLATGAGTAAAPSALDLDGEVSALDAALIIFKDNGSIWTAQG